MKKIILLIVSLIVATVSFAQFSPVPAGSPTSITVNKGAEKSDSGFVQASYTDTTKAVRIKAYDGALIRVGDSLLMRSYGQWKLLNPSGTGTGSVTSVGLTMPSAFSVTNSPITTSGVIGVTANGTTSQYIRGNGTLQTFPNIPTTTNLIDSLRRVGLQVSAQKNGTWVNQFLLPDTSNNTSWKLTGNAGTNPDVNFAGTTDNKSFFLGSYNHIMAEIKPNGAVIGDAKSAANGTKFTVDDDSMDYYFSNMSTTPIDTTGTKLLALTGAGKLVKTNWLSAGGGDVTTAQLHDSINAVDLQRATTNGAATNNNFYLTDNLFENNLLTFENSGSNEGIILLEKKPSAQRLRLKASSLDGYNPTSGNTFDLNYDRLKFTLPSLSSYMYADKLQFFQSSNGLTLQSNTLSSNKTQNFQNKSGTIALLSDISDSIHSVGIDATLAAGNTAYNRTLTIRGTTSNYGISTLSKDGLDVSYIIGGSTNKNIAITPQQISFIGTSGNSTDLLYPDVTSPQTLYLPTASSSRTDTFALLSDINWLATGNDIYNKNTGNVGIGTNAPDASKLQIIKGDGSNVVLSTRATTSGANILEHNIYAPDNHVDLTIKMPQTENDLFGMVGDGTSGSRMYLNYINSDEGLKWENGKLTTIDGNGFITKVGIGTNAPATTLDVNGQIQTIGLTNNGKLVEPWYNRSGSVVLDTTARMVLVSALDADATVTLPNAADIQDGHTITIKSYRNAGHEVVISGDINIEGYSSYSIGDGGDIEISYSIKEGVWLITNEKF